MRQVANFYLKPTVNASFVLILVFSFGLGCGFNNPFRDYSSKPFNSQEWLKGDAIERGRMFRDLYKSRAVIGKSRESILRILGEPDKKSQVEGKEVWSYFVVFSGQSPSNYFIVSFKDNKSGFTETDSGGSHLPDGGQ